MIVRTCVATFLLFAAVVSPSFAARAVYRCVQNGQTVLTDQPCAEPPSNLRSAESAPAPSERINKLAFDLPAVVGDWHGQVQFQGAQGGQQLDAAHSVVPMVLSFTADGKVSGSSDENGCKFLGVWSPGVTPRLFPIDITLTECHFAGLNRRYSGTVTIGSQDKSAQFNLLAYSQPIPGQPVSKYDVGGTLRK